jgi:uncharacterized protein YndB with AHSA1/START domain
MRSPEGQDFWSQGVYREIVEPERIVCTDTFADEEGNTVSPEHYGMSPEWPEEALITVTFAEQAGKTRLTLEHSPLPPGGTRSLPAGLGGIVRLSPTTWPKRLVCLPKGRQRW